MKANKPKIGIIGVGMVGTPLKRWFEEERGHRRGEDLFLYDVDPKKGYFDDINRAEIIFISVPTPRSSDGSCNISAVEAAFGTLKGVPGPDEGRAGMAVPRPAGRDGGPKGLATEGLAKKIVVIKSTVPPGTTEYFQKKYPEHKVLFNPEFLTERKAWEDFTKPDRQIVGFTRESLDAAHAVLSVLPRAPFMSPWGVNTYRSVKITATEAEIIKYGGNVYFSRKINLANALAALSEKMGVDYENVRAGMAADYRIGDSHLDVLHGGYKGFGGYCFPKDLDAFIAHLESSGLNDSVELLKKDREFNENLLAAQGLTLEDVSVHDREWIEKKMSNVKAQTPNQIQNPNVKNLGFGL